MYTWFVCEKKNMDFDQVAKQFSQFYYNAFDNDRRSLAPLYREISMLSFEGKQFVGVNKIIEQLTVRLLVAT